MDFLMGLKNPPDFLADPASRRAFSFNAGFRKLVEREGGGASPNFVAWLTNRAAGFVQSEDYDIVPCACRHVGILEEAAFRGAPVYWCLECLHLVRFGFSGNPVHCERGN